MRVVAVQHGDVPALPDFIEGLPIIGVAEVRRDGKYMAWGVILDAEGLDGLEHITDGGDVVLWWDRYDSPAGWRLTKLEDS